VLSKRRLLCTTSTEDINIKMRASAGLLAQALLLLQFCLDKCFAFQVHRQFNQRGSLSRANSKLQALSDSFSEPATVAAAIVGLGVVGLAGASALNYWNVQYITASMLSNSIRGQNLAVLELGAKDCKSMYYFGEGCVSQLTLQGNPDKINPGIAKSSGQQLGINSVAIKASAKDLPPIYDFVVCVNGLAELGMSGAEAINLAASVLKPEGTFVFIEQLGEAEVDAMAGAAEAGGRYQSFDFDAVPGPLGLGTPTVVGRAQTLVSSAKAAATQQSAATEEGALNRKQRRKQNKQK